MRNAFKPLPDQATLHRQLDYTPSTGALLWRPRLVAVSANKTWNSRFAGYPAGGVYDYGGRDGARNIIGIDNVKYRTQRIVWKWMMGVDPDTEVVALDNNIANLAWTNLSLAQRHETSWKSGIHSNNTSGVKGVFWQASRAKWVGHVAVFGVSHRQRFDRIEDAEAWVRDRRIELHNKFANHG